MAKQDGASREESHRNGWFLSQRSSWSHFDFLAFLALFHDEI
jgi:hypothetical protein